MCRVADSDGTLREEGIGGEGVAQADFILYVSANESARCRAKTTVAYAASCQLETAFDRWATELCTDWLTNFSISHLAEYKVAQLPILILIGLLKHLISPYKRTLRRNKTKSSVNKISVSRDIRGVKHHGEHQGMIQAMVGMLWCIGRFWAAFWKRPGRKRHESHLEEHSTQWGHQLGPVGNTLI